MTSGTRTEVSLSRRLLDRLVLAVSVILAIGVIGGLGVIIGRTLTSGGDWGILITLTAWGAYLVVALIDARHALLFWIMTSPFARFVHLDLELGRGIPNITLNRLMTGILLVLLLAQLATRRRRLSRLGTKDVLLIAFCGALIMSVPQAIDPFKQSIQSVFDLVITPVAVYFLARNLITTREDLGTAMQALVIIGVFLGAMATHEQLTGQVLFYPQDRAVYYTASFRRVVGLLGNPAFIAVCIGAALPWAWYLFLTARRRRFEYLLAAAPMMAGIYFCMNRSGWVGAVVALTTMGILVRRFRRVFVLMLLVAGILAGIYWALIITSSAVRERLSAQGPIEYRQEAWPIAWEMVKDNPLFGVGYENYRHLYKRYGRWDIYLRAEPSPHNTYLWVLVTAGLVAFVPFMLFLLAVASSALGVWRRGVIWERHRTLAPGEADSGSEHLLDADLAGTFLASISAILVPALVMDIFAASYHNMLLFLVIGAFFGAMPERPRRRQRHASVPQDRILPMPQLGSRLAIGPRDSLGPGT